jgi:hypothetical protein
LFVGSPTRENDSEKAERADAKDEENADIDVPGNAEARAAVKGAQGSHRSGHCDDGCKPENEHVGVTRDDVPFHEEPEGVGDELQQTIETNLLGAEAFQEVRHELALKENYVARDERNNRNYDGGANELDPPGLEEVGQALGG